MVTHTHNPVLSRLRQRSGLKVILSLQQFEELEDHLNNVRPCAKKGPVITLVILKIKEKKRKSLFFYLYICKE